MRTSVTAMRIPPPLGTLAPAGATASLGATYLPISPATEDRLGFKTSAAAAKAAAACSPSAARPQPTRHRPHGMRAPTLKSLLPALVGPQAASVRQALPSTV